MSASGGGKAIIAAFLANVSLQEVLDGIPPTKLAAAPLPERHVAAG